MTPCFRFSTFSICGRIDWKFLLTRLVDLQLFEAQIRRLELQKRDRLLPRDEVIQIVGASVPTIYRWMAAGLFPRPITVGPRAVRWMESEIYEWIEDRKHSRAA